MTKSRKKPIATGPGKESMVRTYFVFLVLFLFGLGIIIKAAHIQIFEGAELNRRAEKKEYKYTEIDAIRGNIFSSDGSILATSVPIFEIRFDAASPHISNKLFNDSISHLAYYLSKMFGDKTNWGYKQYMINARKKGKRYLFIQRNVTYEQLSEIKSFPIFNRGNILGGLIAERQVRREYPFGILAKRTIGYARENKNDTTLVGLEGYFNDYLQGIPGLQLRQRMANKAWRPVFSDNDIEPKNGKDVITTIDTYLQDVAENALLIDEFLDKLFESGAVESSIFSDEEKLIKLHGHCHQKSIASIVPTKRMLSFPANFKVEAIPSGCCGMAGSFGYEKEHYDVSMQIGELVLFPTVRAQKEEVAIAAPGTSCRHQIKDGTGRIAKHPVEILWEAIK